MEVRAVDKRQTECLCSQREWGLLFVEEVGHEVPAVVEGEAGGGGGAFVVAGLVVGGDAGAGEGERDVAVAVGFGAEEGGVVG